LDTGRSLPACAIVNTAGEHVSKCARMVCAGLQSGKLGYFDKAYVNFDHLHELAVRGASWVKDHFPCCVVGPWPAPDQRPHPQG
jgi:hypothetical protein